MTDHSALRRHDTKARMVAEFERTLEDRVERSLEVGHAGIVAQHHFSAASSECLDVYRDGHFLSAVMVSQAVAEGIWKFVLERNHLPRSEDRPSVAPRLVADGILSPDCTAAFIRIWGGFRNDIHHMNPKVAEVPFAMLAKRNLVDLGTIERELFAWAVTEPGKLTPTQPKCWDLQADGTAPVSLRNPWL
jgi:hypothetical protein